MCEGAGLHYTMATELELLPGNRANSSSSSSNNRGGGRGVGESGGVVLAEKMTGDMYVDLDQVKDTCFHSLCREQLLWSHTLLIISLKHHSNWGLHISIS